MFLIDHFFQVMQTVVKSMHQYETGLQLYIWLRSVMSFLFLYICLIEILID